MLSNLPKLADRNFVIGFLMPTLLALFGAAWAFPHFKPLSPLRDLAVTAKSLEDLVYVGLGSWLLAVLLMTANHSLYRLLEGYLPPISWFTFLSWRHRRRLRQLKAEYDLLEKEYGAVFYAGRTLPTAKMHRRRQLRQIQTQLYPGSEDFVLPTQFGNAIRAFEVYSTEVYGADSIPVWLRLASVIPKDFTALIDDARARVDFFLNLTATSFIIATSALGIGALQLDWSSLATTDASFVGWAQVLGSASGRNFSVAIVGYIVSFLTYRSATGAVFAWGDLVKSAFDCYLPALAKQLGYANPPTPEARKRFWTEFSRLVLYRSPMVGPWPLASEATKQGGEPTKPNGAEHEADGAAEPGKEEEGNRQQDTMQASEPLGGSHSARTETSQELSTSTASNRISTANP